MFFFSPVKSLFMEKKFFIVDTNIFFFHFFEIYSTLKIIPLARNVRFGRSWYKIEMKNIFSKCVHKECLVFSSISIFPLPQNQM